MQERKLYDKIVLRVIPVNLMKLTKALSNGSGHPAPESGIKYLKAYAINIHIAKQPHTVPDNLALYTICYVWLSTLIYSSRPLP